MEEHQDSPRNSDRLTEILNSTLRSLAGTFTVDTESSLRELREHVRRAIAICNQLATLNVLAHKGLEGEAWLSTHGIPSDVAQPHPEVMELPDDRLGKALAVQDIQRCVISLSRMSTLLGKPEMLSSHNKAHLLWEVRRVLQHCYDHLEYDCDL
jgi:hypothetical protein